MQAAFLVQSHPGVRKEVPAGITLAERGGMKRGDKAHLTRDQAERLLTCPAVPEMRKVIYALAMTSGGFRSGELYGLTWADIELDAPIPVVHVTKALVEKGEDGWATVGKTKTPDAVRDNPLHPLAARSLRAWKAGGWVQRVGRQAKPTDPVFPDEKGEARRPADSANLQADLVKAGVATKYGTVPITFKDANRCRSHTR